MKKKKSVMEDIVLENGKQVTLKRRGGIVIEVVDDGVGMTPDQVKTVFNDGTQFNANKFQAGGGSGLGLNIAKGIANGHNGKLTCSSTGIDQGTTFTLTLPLYNSLEDDTTNLDETSKSIEWLEAPPADLRVLVVDDSNLNRKLCIRLLEKHGHTCDGACDGKEAVQKVKDSFRNGRDSYDCILLDYEMPNMNGPEACQKIRKLGSSAHIVGVTGNVMSEDVECFRAAGANWVLPKPFRIEALEQQWVEYGITGNKMLQGRHDSFQVEGPQVEFDLNSNSQHN
jgi:CheY-like chemotaxis protein